MGIFLRQSHNVKPPRWGSFADVQYAIRVNSEKIYGCNPDDDVLVMPLFWGLQALDYSGYNNHGTNHGATYKDGSLDFDGVDDYVDAGASTDFDLTELSISAWIKFDPPGVGNNFMMVTKGNWEAGCYQFYVKDTNQISFATYLTPATQPSGGNVGDGEFHHVAATFDGENIKVYVDTDEYSGTGLSLDTNTNALLLGKRADYEAKFKGIIDEVRVSSIIRTPDQIALFNDNKYGLYQKVSRPIWSIPAAPEVAVTSLDALIKKTISTSLSLDALLQTSVPITVSIDGIIKAIGEIATTNLDANIQEVNIIETLSIDALLQRLGISSSLSIDALVEKGLSESSSLDALIKKYGVIFQTTIDSLISKTETDTTIIDALLLKSITQELYLDAILYAQKTASVTMDSYVSKLQSVGTSLDAIIAAFEAETELDALISRLNNIKIVSLDALLLESRVATTTLDSIISEQLSHHVNMDGLLSTSGVITTTFLDAIIYAALVEATSKYEFFVEAQDSFVVEAQQSFSAEAQESFRYIP